MREKIIVFAICFSLSGIVISAEEQISTDLMQTIEDTNKSLSSNLALGDAKAATSDAKELTELFAKVESFFAQRGDAENAVELSKKIRSLAINIEKSVAANDFTSAANSATDLSRTCRTCHTFYKKE